MKSKDLENRIASAIKDILISKNIDIEIVDDLNLNKNVINLTHENSNIIDSQDLELDYLDEYFIFTNSIDLYKCDKQLKNITDRINYSNNEYNSINIYYICESLEDKIYFENKIKEVNLNKKISENIKNHKKSKKVNKDYIEINSIFIGNLESKEFKVNIKSRIRSLETSRNVYIDNDKKTGLEINGYVFIANLESIVKIYNSLGNLLFTNNVRYMIGDELNVDLEIKNTLRTNPEEFWYLNNGITMVIQDEEFALNKIDSLTLRYKEGRDNVISIINGAQTVSASSEFFYSTKYTGKQKLRAKEDAKVMFRIIHINKINKSMNRVQTENYLRACNKEVDKISISLNRQKPIKSEDIAYTMPFVYTINELKDNNEKNEFYFGLTRRGEKAINGYDLAKFARATKAYLAQRPGSARTSGVKALLDITSIKSKEGIDSENNNSHINTFKDSSIFKEEIIYTKNIKKTFYKYYKPVNFAIKISTQYETYVKYIERNNKINTEKNKYNDELMLKSLKYGKWYFVAYITYVLNNYSNEDFSDFNTNINILKSNHKLEDYIDRYIAIFTDIAKESKKNLDSNDFKNERLYDIFKNYENEGSNIKIKMDIIKFNEDLQSDCILNRKAELQAN